MTWWIIGQYTEADGRKNNCQFRDRIGQVSTTLDDVIVRCLVYSRTVDA